MREEVARGRGSVALQVLSQFLRTFFVSQIFRLQSTLLLFFCCLMLLYSLVLFHFIFLLYFNEQSMAHASVLSLMWSVQSETAGE